MHAYGGARRRLRAVSSGVVLAVETVRKRRHPTKVDLKLRGVPHSSRIHRSIRRDHIDARHSFNRWADSGPTAVREGDRNHESRHRTH